MEDVAADEPEDAFEIKRAQHLPGDDAVLEARGEAVDRGDHQTATFAVIVPGTPVRQLRRHVLAEEASPRAAQRRQAVVEGGGSRNSTMGSRLHPKVRAS